MKLARVAGATEQVKPQKSSRGLRARVGEIKSPFLVPVVTPLPKHNPHNYYKEARRQRIVVRFFYNQSRNKQTKPLVLDRAVFN